MPARRPPSEARARSSSRSSGATSSRPPPPAPTRRALEPLYVRHHYAVRPGRRGDPQASAPLQRARAWSSRPVVYLAGMLRARRRGIDTDAWTWLSNQAGQQLFYPPNVSGWDDTRWLDTASFLARWNLAGRVLRPSVLKGDDKAPLERREAARPRARLLGPAATHAPDEARAEVVRPPRDQRRRPEMEEGAVPAADRERAAPPDRHLPGLADVMRASRLQRALTFRAPAQGRRRRRERGCPTSSRGCRCPPARASTAAASSPARSGSRSPSTARRALTPRALDHGIAQALAAGPSDTVLVSVFLDGGIDSLSVLFPHGDPDYRRLRPKLALPDSGLVFPEDPRLRWHPSAAAFHTLHAEGKLLVLPAVGYTNADQSHFTSRHYWEVGDTDSRPPDGLARPLPRPCRQGRQPAPGREPRRRALAVARDREEARRRAERRRRLLVLGAGRLRPGRGPHAVRRRLARLLARAATRRSRERARSPSSRTGCASSSRPSTRRIQQPPFRTRSRTAASRISSPGSPRCSLRACRCTASP